MSEKVNFHLYLGKKDFEILVWKNSLPPKCFKYFAEQILLSHINGYKILLPPINYDVLEEEVITGKPIHIVTENPQIISFLSEIESGDKSKVVKDILLFYIRESRESYLISDNKKKKKKQNAPHLPREKRIEKKDAQTSRTPTVDESQQSTVAKPTVAETVFAPIAETPSQNEHKEKSPKSPMMQALFKMSGDE